MNFEEIKPFIRHIEKINANNLIPQILKSYDACIIYTILGKGTIIIDDIKYYMSSGSVLMWRANQKYHICTSHEKTEYLIIHFDFTNENCVTNSFKIMPEPLTIFNEDRIVDNIVIDDCTEFNSTIYIPSAKHLEELFLGINSEFKKPKKHMNMRIGAKMTIILSYISNSYVLNTSSKNIDKAYEIIEYIHENYTKDLTNSDIAKHFNFHPQHINKIVKRKTGYSLHKYVIMRRISKAIDLIETTKMSIAEIAEKIGFQNVCHFSRYFKEFMGTSPRAYRKRVSS